MLLITGILGLMLLLLIIEKLIVQRCVNSLPLRIHVNGTRGKSTVTEYIGAGILGANMDVIAKITGVIPTFFYNGVGHAIKRTGAPRVHEQFGLMRLASKLKVKGLVLECMSIAPALQRIESSVFRPHIYVITNIRDDHSEEMGKNIEEMADHICGAIPSNCTVVTNEIRFLNRIKETAVLRNSRVIGNSDFQFDRETELPSGVFPENYFLALTVCQAAGIDNKMAREGILKRIFSTRPSLITIRVEEKEVSFLDAFSANDVDSTQNVIDDSRKRLGYSGKISLLLNTRADRPLRTERFTTWIATISASVGQIIITGNHAKRAMLSLLRADIPKENIHIRKDRHLKDLKSDLLKIGGEGALVVGIGNIGGSGFKILKELQ